MKGRKTLNVEDFKNRCNDMLKHSEPTMIEMRHGIIFALEEALRMTGNYQGFKYLCKRDVPSGIPGIRENNDFTNTDETRRMYF